MQPTHFPFFMLVPTFLASASVNDPVPVLLGVRLLLMLLPPALTSMRGLLLPLLPLARMPEPACCCCSLPATPFAATAAAPVGCALGWGGGGGGGGGDRMCLYSSFSQAITDSGGGPSRSTSTCMAPGTASKPARHHMHTCN